MPWSTLAAQYVVIKRNVIMVRTVGAVNITAATTEIVILDIIFVVLDLADELRLSIKHFLIDFNARDKIEISGLRSRWHVGSFHLLHHNRSSR